MSRADRAVLLRSLSPVGMVSADELSACNWRRTVSLAGRYGIAGNLSALISRSEVVPPVPARESRRLLDLVERTAAQNALALAETGEFVAELRRRGVSAVLHKGAALLAWSVYEHFGQRHLDDVDLMVDAEAERAVREVADSLGWGEVHARDIHGRAVRPSHSLALLRTPTGTLVDMHHRTAVDPEAAARIRRSAEDVRLLGYCMRRPSTQDLLRDLCDHVIVQNAAADRLLPRHAADVLRLLATDRSLERDSSWSVVESVRLARAASLGKSRARLLGPTLFGPTSPHEIRRKCVSLRRGVDRTIVDLRRRPMEALARVVPAPAYFDKAVRDADYWRAVRARLRTSWSER